MKITIKGNNPITSENVKTAIDSLNNEYSKYGMKIKNMTCYVRFIDENGMIVEPLVNGKEIEKIYNFTTAKEIERGVIKTQP